MFPLIFGGCAEKGWCEWNDIAKIAGADFVKVTLFFYERSATTNKIFGP